MTGSDDDKGSGSSGNSGGSPSAHHHLSAHAGTTTSGAAGVPGSAEPPAQPLYTRSSSKPLPTPPPSSSIVDGQAPPPAAIPFLKAALRSSAFLQGLKDEELHVSGKDLTELVMRARAVRFPPGASLIEQGSKFSPSTPRPLYVIQEGESGVYIRRKHAGGAQASMQQDPAGVRVGTVRAGNILGDNALYSDTPSSVSIKVDHPKPAVAAAAAVAGAGAAAALPPAGVLAWRIDKAAFDEWIASRPAVKRSLEQRTWLWHALSKNYLFRGLDDDLQKERLLSRFEHHVAAPMQPVVQFGERGDRFYVVETGTCAVEVPQITGNALAPVAPSATPATPADGTPPSSPAAQQQLSSLSSASLPAAPSSPPRLHAAPPLVLQATETDEEEVPASSKTGRAGKVVHAPSHGGDKPLANQQPSQAELDAAQKSLASGKAWSGHNPLLPHVPMVTVAHKGPGESFGEIALLYNVPRCATVRCVSPSGCGLWSVDAPSFLSCASKGSLYLKRTFFQYASVRDASNNELLMTQQDFTRAVRDTKWAGKHGGAKKGNDPLNWQLNERSLKLMFHLADQSGDELISFSEFVLLYGLLQAPFTKYQLAFRLFDKDKNGFIDRGEFLQVVRSLSEDEGNKVSQMRDLANDPFIVELFGPDPSKAAPGKHKASTPEKQLTYAEFESLLQRDVLPSFLASVNHDLQLMSDYWTSVDLSLSGAAGSEAGLSGSALSAAPTSATGAAVSSGISWKSLVAGGVAGAVSRTIVSPFERLKLLFQMQGTPPRYTGVLQGLRLIHAEDGLRGFFRGNLSNVIRITPASAFQFFFYDCFKKLFFGDRRDLNPLERLGAGGCAGMTACLLTYPLDFIRARLTLQGGDHVQYRGIWHGLSSVVKTEGVRGVYKGLWPSLVGIFPYIGIDFAVYETLRTHLPPSMKNERGESSRVALFCCGAVAGMVGQTVAYPLDLVRRRMQVQGFGGTTYHYSGGILSTMRAIVRAEGVQGLYRGMIPNYVKVVPAVSVSFVVYEQMRRMLDMSPAGH